jgi:hypothetical protein
VSGKGRALFYQYLLGSTREARDWYFKARNVLGMEIFNDRVQIITDILRLLVTMISHQCGYLVREDPALYETNPD